MLDSGFDLGLCVAEGLKIANRVHKNMLEYAELGNIFLRLNGRE